MSGTVQQARGRARQIDGRQLAALFANATVQRRLNEQIGFALGQGIHALRATIASYRNPSNLAHTLERIVDAIEASVAHWDAYTANHERRVAHLCVHIAARLGLSEHRTHGLRMAARIHDLGKMILPGEILCRPGLTPIQLDLVQQHARLGYEIIKNVPFPWPVAEIVRQHHERMDGSGYPRGLAETDILLEARILAVADVVEAIAIARPYRSGLGVEAALQEIRRGCGTLYDAAVVDACVILFRLESYEFPDLQKSGGWQPARPLLAPVSAMVSTPPVGPDQNAALAA